MKLTLLAMCAGLALAQTKPVAISTPGPLVQINNLSSGTVLMEAVSLQAGMNISRGSDGKLTVTAPAVTLPMPTQTGIIDLTLSPTDPLTWCTTSQPPTSFPTYIPVLISEIHTFNLPPSPIWTENVFSLLQIGNVPSTMNPGLSTSIGPRWVKGACAGLDGIVFPSASLSAGESRTAVSVYVAF
jgi:hypothetical protein